MERLSKSKKRAGSDLPKRKRKHSGNDTLEHLREASVEIVNRSKNLNLKWNRRKVQSPTNPYASADEESTRKILNNASYVHATTANAKPRPA